MLTLRRYAGEVVLVGDAAAVRFEGFADPDRSVARVTIVVWGARESAEIRLEEGREILPGVSVWYGGNQGSQAVLGFVAPRSLRVDRSEVREYRSRRIVGTPAKGGPV